ncbi:MAG TPA: haloacid dehalogenase-like hydrolase [Plantibacter sp.]|uniref:HAD family hydrolase n=1 Tax=Plantibacter sp. TaxID=1871045 RepID=UPI002C746F3F|nr:haloacid dehalogenase-like hydrolase [Plantibacter sp.]
MTASRFEGAILWDLDGTLLTTAKAGRIALRAAVLEVTGREADYAELQTSGLTDAEVALEAVRAVGIEPDAELLLRVRLGYERRLPEALLLKEGGVLPGVLEALDGLAERGRIVSLLLTGNTAPGARAKLERYGMGNHFPHGGGFCDGPGGRAPIARRALRIAEELVPELSIDRVLLVGDTPRDVECASELGVRSVGLTSGTHSSEELLAAGAWRVLDRVPVAATLEALTLGEPDRGALHSRVS